MSVEIKTDICVIGAGSAGLSVAAGAAMLGVDTVLIERDRMGGDCLYTGCVPSKALIAAAHARHAAMDTGRLGVDVPAPPPADLAKVRDHIRRAIAAIEPHDSQERFEGLGVRVIRGHARFTAPRTLDVDGTTVRARRMVIATGSTAAVPPIPGLDSVPFLTNETVFDLDTLPRHLVIVGGGPIGAELGQAYRRLGAEITIVDAADILNREPDDVRAIIRNRLAEEGVTLRLDTAIAAVRQDGDDIVVDGAEGEIARGSHLLVAVGRKPAIAGLGLEAAGIETDRNGIVTDDRLRTTERKTFAIGDVAGRGQFTHLAGYHAGIVIRNALFRLPAKATAAAIPRVTYTDPEVAAVGLDAKSAQEQYGDKVKCETWPFATNDRAIADARREGFLEVVTLGGKRVLGATMVGPSAGELIQPWIAAVDSKLSLKSMATVVAPYPTLGEINKRTASAFLSDAVFNPRMKRLVRFLSWFG